MNTYFGLPVENTADFEYIFEDVVQLPEFVLFHMGFGIYRFREPVICSENRFDALRKKYRSLIFYYMGVGEADIKLLFVKSADYNRAEFTYISNAMHHSGFAAVIPEGYDADVDRIRNVDRHSEISYTTPRYDRVLGYGWKQDGLLGFRWEPERYYDSYGRRLYIMIDGCVAKRIADNLYAFQGAESYDRNNECRYPLIHNKNKITDRYTEFRRCAVVGSPHWEGGSLLAYCGTNVRYIAFDDIGICLLKRLYEYTIGYEYREFSLGQKEPADRSVPTLEQSDELKNSYQPGRDAMELVKGIGYRDITINYRMLFCPGSKVRDTPELHDFTYIENGVLKLVDFIGKMQVRSIPVGILAELSVVKKMQLCHGIEENLLIKVIDNVWFEKNCIGADNYDSYMEYIRGRYHIYS